MTTPKPEPDPAVVIRLANRYGYQLFKPTDSGRKFKIQTPVKWVTLKHGWILFANPTRDGWRHFKRLEEVAAYIERMRNKQWVG